MSCFPEIRIRSLLNSSKGVPPINAAGIPTNSLNQTSVHDQVRTSLGCIERIPKNSPKMSAIDNP